MQASEMSAYWVVIDLILKNLDNLIPKIDSHDEQNISTLKFVMH